MFVNIFFNISSFYFRSLRFCSDKEPLQELRKKKTCLPRTSYLTFYNVYSKDLSNLSYFSLCKIHKLKLIRPVSGLRILKQGGIF